MKNADDNNDDDNDDDYADTHQGWIIVRDGKYSVADKKKVPSRSPDGVIDRFLSIPGTLRS